MCRSMADIHSATAEIRRGKKKEERKKKKPQGKNIMSASATQGGHNNVKKIDQQIQLRYMYKLCNHLQEEME